MYEVPQDGIVLAPEGIVNASDNVLGVAVKELGVPELAREVRFEHIPAGIPSLDVFSMFCMRDKQITQVLFKYFQKNALLPEESNAWLCCFVTLAQTLN